jgi:hypothetical protein
MGEEVGGDFARDVELYAALSTRLAHPEADRGAILAQNGLDEAAWETVDQLWQTRLSEAIDAYGEEEGVPPLVAAFSAAFARAQATGAPEVLPFPRFVEATRALMRGEADPNATLKRFGVSLAEYLRAQQHWTRAMAEDPQLLERFQRGTGG